MSSQSRPPADHAEPWAQSAPAPGAAADLPVAADAEATRIFEDEVRSAISYERGLAVKALAALAIVVLVVAVRMLFLG